MGIHWQEEKHTPVHLKKMCLFPWEMKKKKKKSTLTEQNESF